MHETACVAVPQFYCQFKWISSLKKQQSVVSAWCPCSSSISFIALYIRHTFWSLPAILRFYTVILPQEGRKHCQEATGCNEWQGYLPQWNLNEGWCFLLCIVSAEIEERYTHCIIEPLSFHFMYNWTLGHRKWQIPHVACLQMKSLVEGKKKVSQQIMLTRNISFCEWDCSGWNRSRCVSHLCNTME